jgi:hypothetical protein
MKQTKLPIDVEIKRVKATCPTHVIKIYIAGDRQLARQVLQRYVMKGLCVSISEEEYVYTLGNESGIVVNFINYPRFPKTPEELLLEATELAKHLIMEMYQGSCTVVDYNGDSYFFSRRND